MLTNMQKTQTQKRTRTSHRQNSLTDFGQLNTTGLGIAGGAHAFDDVFDYIMKVQGRARGLQRSPVGLKKEGSERGKRLSGYGNLTLPR